ncbi:MAG: murein biosynthesis integral membrane protein MurJ [Phycisphaerales bacterium]|nr:murein biosynthesis integral membrane protein MurJ [Phycisphaerales bacterium]
MSDIRQVVRATRFIALLTLGSRVVGLAREMMFAHYFSAGPILSAFRIAFMVPNLSRRLFGEGALSSSLIPVLTDVLHREGEAPARRLAGSILLLMTAGLTALTIVAEAGLWIAVHWMDEPALELTALLLPYMVLICATAVAGGVLNVRHHFASPAAAPVVMNVAMILGTWLGARMFQLSGRPLIYAVCAATLLSGVVQAWWQFAALRKVGFMPIFAWDGRSEPVRRVFRMMGPMILGLSTVQISSLADYLVAYVAVTNAAGERVGPAVLGYAQYLYQLPLGVFGIALATAVFPLLSARAAEGDTRGVIDVLTRGVRLSLFIGLPSAAGMIVIAVPMVRVLFERGEFGPADTQRVAGAVVYYALGIAAYCTQHVVVRTFYALKDSATPMRIAAAAVALNLLLNIVLVRTPMQERGIALATAISSTVQVLWLMRRLRERLPELRWRPVFSALSRMAAATGLMLVALLMLPAAGGVGRLAAGRRWVELVMLLLIGLASYAVAAWLLRIDELGMITGRSRPAESIPPSSDAHQRAPVETIAK